MIRVLSYTIITFLALFLQQVQAQRLSTDEKIKLLEEKREMVEEREKKGLKYDVYLINKHLEQGEITEEEAQHLKEEAAKKCALNIENKLAIIDNQLALARRGEDYRLKEKEVARIQLALDSDEEDALYGIRYKRGDEPMKYDRRTTSNVVLAFGQNNALIDGKLNDSPYDAWGSRFFELGWVWSTRVFENTNAVRFRYGLSFQFNGLNPKNSQYFAVNEDNTYLADYPAELKKSKFRVDNLVVPVHFEFGPSTVKKTEEFIRYSTARKFKWGIGGYAGLNMAARQKLKYELEGDTKKEKLKGEYNVNDFIYGLSTYVGIGDISLYFKYDLNPLFDNAIIDQNNISMGVRFDL